MKSSIFLLTLATVINYAGCNPLPEEIFQLEARNGPYCHVLQNDTPCRKGAGSAYSNKRAVDKSENAGGVCKAYDTYKNTWIWIQGWHCWIAAVNLNSACAGQQPWCAAGSGQCPTKDC